MRVVEDSDDWVDTTSQWLALDDRRCIVLADNAEREYFRRGLVPMSRDNYLRMASRPEFTDGTGRGIHRSRTPDDRVEPKPGEGRGPRR